MIPYLIYAAIHLITLLGNISSNAVSVAFPNIISSFNTSLVLAGWVISIYLLVATGATVLIGKLSDTLGRKKVFLICTAFFILGSLLSAIAPNIQLLIFFRFIQAIGGGGFGPAVVGIMGISFRRAAKKLSGSAWA